MPTREEREEVQRLNDEYLRSRGLAKVVTHHIRASDGAPSVQWMVEVSVSPRVAFHAFRNGSEWGTFDTLEDLRASFNFCVRTRGAARARILTKIREALWALAPARKG